MNVSDIERSFGLKIVGGQVLPWSNEQLGAFVATIYPGSVADRLHGELQEGLHFKFTTFDTVHCFELHPLFNIQHCASIYLFES